jgi:hypothetical protein
MRYSLNAGYGQLLGQQIAASVGPVFGKIMVVVSSSDEAQKQDMMKEVFIPDPDGEIRFYSTLEAAYAAATSNADDIILLSGHSTHTVANGIAWSKSRIHVIGMDGGHRLIQQGAKVASTDGAGDAYVMKVTGTRNSFENIKFIQNDTDAAALTCVQDGGEGTVWKNCSVTFGVADNLDQTDAYEFVAGSDSSTYINCTFGQDTLLTSAARTVMAIDIVNGTQRFKNNIFKDCLWMIASSDTDANHIRILANTDVVFSSTFINPVFTCSLTSSTSAAAIDDSVDSVSGLVEGNLLFVNPASNATEFCTGVTDQIEVVGPAVNAAAGEAVTPS